MKPRSCIAMVCCFFLTPAMPALASTAKFPLVVYGVDYPPYLSADSKSPGLLNALVSLGAKLVGVEVEFRSRPLRRAIARFSQDENSVLLESRDVIPGDLLHKVMAFPLISVNNHLVVRPDFPDLPSGGKRFERLSGLTGAILAGAEDELAFANEVEAKTIASQSLDQSLTMLLKKRVDFFICLTLTCLETLEKNGVDSKQAGIVKDSIYSFSVDLLVHKSHGKNQELIRILLKKLYESGGYERIIRAHYKDVPPSHAYDRLIRSNL